MQEHQREQNSKEFHRRYGGTVYNEDFYSAEYYSPKHHLKHFLEDLDWEEELMRRALNAEEE